MLISIIYTKIQKISHKLGASELAYSKNMYQIHNNANPEPKQLEQKVL